MKQNIREVDINEYMPLLISLLDKGITMPLVITGNSMTPFLVHMRDIVYISKPKNVLKKGDIVFFKRMNGDFVIHRIWNINKKNQLFIIGDGQLIIEGPIESNQILGVVKKVNRKNRMLTEKNWIWRFFSIFWIRIIKYRPIFVRIISALKLDKKQNKS